MRRIQVHPVHWSTLESELAAWRQLDATFGSYDPVLTKMHNYHATPTERLEIILSYQSLFVRATDLALFLEKCPPESLKDNYQLIVDSIFTPKSREQSWDLRALRRTEYTREASAVFKLMAPDGPLITLALRLMDDHSFLLEFSLDNLPYYLRQRLSQLDVPPYLNNKVGISFDIGLQRNVIQHLLLNPFEYYMFSFGAINLLGPNPGRTSDYLQGWAALQDTFYTNILDDYLTYYFPCDGSGVPSHNFNYVQQATENVFMSNSLLSRQYAKQKLIGDNSSHQMENTIPKLFKTSIIQDQSGTTGTRENLFLTTHPSAYKEVWRSETILHIFMELWMCGFHESKDKNESVSPLKYGGLPSVEVVKSVRMLVRNLHFFINCVNSRAMHPMEEVRRNSYPIFQRRLYTFLRYLFHHWPLDNSFRIVYETWLSHIQPWRYMNFDKQRTHTAKELAETPIDRRWFNFISENILFYSKLYNQILLRLERVDLSATKNALMFYRLAKVFTTQESFKSMLLEIETSLQQFDRQMASSTSLTHHPGRRTLAFSTPASSGRGESGMSSYFGGGNLSPILSSPLGSPMGVTAFHIEQTSSLKISNMKQHIREYEGTHYVYEPIFSEENTRRMQRLLVAANEGREAMLASAAKISEKKDAKKSLYVWLSDFWNNKPLDQVVANEVAEKNKAANQLEFARNQFALFYGLQITDQGGVDYQNSGSLNDTRLQNGSGGSSRSASGMYYENDKRKSYLPASVLVDETLVSFGNPDVSLVRSDEWGPLVRFMYWTSSLINERIGDRLEELYFQKGWKGRFTRAIIAEPKQYIESSRPPGPGIRRPLRASKYLPPRINLRFLGSYYTFCYFFIWIVLCNFFNLGSISSVIWLSLLYLVFLCFRAASEPINKYGELHQLHSAQKIVQQETSFNNSLRGTLFEPESSPSMNTSAGKSAGTQVRQRYRPELCDLDESK